MQPAMNKPKVRFAETASRRYGPKQYASAVIVRNLPNIAPAQLTVLQLLDEASDEIGPVQQFTVSDAGDVRIQLKFNWTQEDALDVNYEPHRRLLTLLEEHCVTGKSIRAEVSEYATKSTNEGRALNLNELIAKVRADEARRAQAQANRAAKPGSVVTKANPGAAATSAPERVATTEQGTQTPRIPSQVSSSGDKSVDLPSGHWLRQLRQFRCPVCADEVEKIRAVVALACGHLLCEPCYGLIQQADFGGVAVRRQAEGHRSASGAVIAQGAPAIQVMCPKCLRVSIAADHAALKT
jgi:hypothetical protein